MVAAGKGDWCLFDCEKKKCKAGLTTQNNVDGFK